MGSSRVSRSSASRPGTSSAPGQHGLVVVGGPQPQGTVRRPGAGGARDDADVLAVGMLARVGRRAVRVLEHRGLGVGWQHEPLDHGRAAGHARTAR